MSTAAKKIELVSDGGQLVAFDPADLVAQLVAARVFGQHPAALACLRLVEEMERLRDVQKAFFKEKNPTVRSQYLKTAISCEQRVDEAIKKFKYIVTVTSNY